MSWTVGDLAFCISDDWEDMSKPFPKKGELYRVDAIDDAPNIVTGDIMTGLGLSDFPPEHGWHPKRFRKVNPDGTTEGDAEKIKLGDLLKQGVPS